MEWDDVLRNLDEQDPNEFRKKVEEGDQEAASSAELKAALTKQITKNPALMAEIEGKKRKKES